MAKIRLDARRLIRDRYTLNVEIRNVRRATAQLWLALRLVRLAAWIGNFGLKENQAVGVIVTDKGPAPTDIIPLTENPFSEYHRQESLSRGDSNHGTKT